MFLNSTSDQLIRAGMWYLTSAQKEVFSWDFRVLNETLGTRCDLETKIEFVNVLCRNETRAFVQLLLEESVTSPQAMPLADAVQHLVELLQKIDLDAAHKLVGVFEQEAVRYQNRPIHG